MHYTYIVHIFNINININIKIIIASQKHIVKILFIRNIISTWINALERICGYG